MLNQNRGFITWSLLLMATLVSAADDPPAGLAVGAELVESGDYDEALEFFQNLSSETDAAWIDHFEGWIHLLQGDTDVAIDKLAQAVEAAPGSALFQRRLGDAYVRKIDEVGMLKKMGIANKARTAYEVAVEIAPDDLDARVSLTGYYLNAPAIAGGSRAKAEEQVAVMRRLDPAKGHLLMGRVHWSEQEWQEAVLEFRAAIDAGHSNAATWYLLGFALQQDERYEEAFAAFERALEVDPNHLDAYYQIGRTAVFSECNLDRAVECLSLYLEKPPQSQLPGHEHAHWRLGMVYELQDKKTLAEEQYRAALAVDPDHEEARKALEAL